MRYKTGIVCGAFDLIHPGYIDMFLDANEMCHELIVLLHDDPSAERPGIKLKPIMNATQRAAILISLRWVDRVIVYSTEDSLKKTLQELDYQVRFLGSDYIGKEITKDDKDIPVVYLNRDHGWSNTKLVKMIIERGLPNENV